MYPNVCQDDSKIKVEFGRGSASDTFKSIKMILDLGIEGDILSIEILDFLFNTSKNGLEIIDQVVLPEGGEMRFAYDDESDSFFLRLHPGNSLNQKSVHGVAACDEQGRILSLYAKF